MIDTINNVNREVAQELDKPEDIVRAVNAFFWKEVNKSIAAAEHTSIYIKGICTLATSRNKLNLRIRRCIKEIRYFRTTDKVFKRKNKEKAIEAKLEELTKLLDLRNRLAIIYKNNQDRRNATYTKATLGEQTSDCDGPGEQVLFPERDQAAGPEETSHL